MTKTLTTLVPYTEYVQRLQKAGIPNPAQEVRLIMAHVLQMSEALLMQASPQSISSEDRLKLDAAMTARESRKPLERILEHIDFAGLRLRVGEAIYKPYRETEDALTHAVALFQDTKNPLRILDLGTGSGCILLALLDALPHATGVGIDNSPEALALAEENAKANNLHNRAVFRQGHWSQDIEETFDLVISNPPRVATADIARLMPEMRQYDPVTALDGGEDGLRFFRWLAEDFKRLIKSNGIGFVQVGPRYALKIIEIFHQAGLTSLDVKTNFAGHPMALVYRHKVSQQRGKLWFQEMLRFIRLKYTKIRE